MAEYLHDWEKKWKQITSEAEKKGKLSSRLRPSGFSSFAVLVGMAMKTLEAKPD